MAKKQPTNSRSISIGPIGNLTFVQSQNIISVAPVKSDNPEKPYCLHIELSGGKSKHIYFALESDIEKDLKKISVEKEKILKENNFRP